MTLFICYPRCSTCKKAEKWLIEKGVDFDFRDISKENPSYEELKKWTSMSELPIKRFFNTSGLVYRDNNIKDKLDKMSDDEKLKLLATNGMLVKRPIIVHNQKVYDGFNEKVFEEIFS